MRPELFPLWFISVILLISFSSFAYIFGTLEVILLRTPNNDARKTINQHKFFIGSAVTTLTTENHILANIFFDEKHNSSEVCQRALEFSSSWIYENHNVQYLLYNCFKIKIVEFLPMFSFLNFCGTLLNFFFFLLWLGSL